MQVKDYDKAIADYSEIIRLKPKNAHGYMKRSYLYEQKGDLPKAIADCEQAIKLDPKDQEAQTRKKAMQSKQSQAQPPGQPAPAPARTP
jgi:tetratricopeptide (TPR) repeat protein